MKVSVVKGGGMVPIVVTTTVDTVNLAPKDAEKLQAMVDDSGLFELSPSGDPTPDAATYELTVEDERRSCRIVLNDAEMPAGVRSLLAWTARSKAAKSRSARSNARRAEDGAAQARGRTGR